ncbi:hypothetical protein D3C78_1131040 [compost metagenome]
MPAGDEFGNHRGDGALHDPRGGLQHGHLLAELAGRGGQLQADEATGDDDHRLAVLQAAADAPRVLEGAQHLDAEQLAAANRQGARTRPGGQHQVVVLQYFAAAEDDAVGRGTDGADLGVAQQIDALVGIEAFRLEQQLLLALRRAVTAHEGLGQRRTVVGIVRLVADQGDLSVEVRRPQGRGEAATAMTRPDNNDSFHNYYLSEYLPDRTLRHGRRKRHARPLRQPVASH